MAAERRLSVDWPACKGHGLCAELVPELITLDEWGYPILADRPVTRGVQGHAQRAVAACPTLALVLVEQPVPSAPPVPPAADDPISGAIAAATGSSPVQRRPEPAPPQSSWSPAPSPEPARPPEPEPVRASEAVHPPELSRRRDAPRRPQPVRNPQLIRNEEPTRSQEQIRHQEPARSPQPTWSQEQIRSQEPARERQRPAPADDPITGAILAVTGPNAAPRRTPPTGMARHATPAYGQAALVPDRDPDEPYHPFFDEYEPRDPYASGQPTSRRQARQSRQAKQAQPAKESQREEPRENPEQHRPRTRREARNRR
ncbi:ferredoxin [Kineosporia sp. J2-2]|uniref:Ferredoxin n=1 Tax=Kineosporia corallincola TaxID=2835133 RepID=A0ABS5TJD6_9ACTN|nr:ferredoxin [Kineosporia corallincola]MBT0771130.1 ferredoxin [Kineosporia corallincola]